MRALLIFINLLWCSCALAQDYAISHIPSEVSKDAKAVVQQKEVTVKLLSKNKMQVSVKEVATIYSPEGDFYRYLPMFYDKNTKIKEYGGNVYYANGVVFKKFKKNEYVDRSAVDGGTLYGDDRVLVYDYIPTQYPYTIEQFSTYESSNTAFLPRWIPVNSPDIGYVSSTYEFVNESGIKVNYRELNAQTSQHIKQETTGNGYKFSLTNFKPIKEESLSPDIQQLVPGILLAPAEFSLVGYEGSSKDWKSFGKWMYDDLIQNRQNLPAAEKTKVKNLISGLSIDYEKVRVLYQYMQEKTRYINIAIGIGGWQHYPAEYVSTKGFGDCKALTNYMMALLQEAGIKSNYTVVYGDSSVKRDIIPDFPSLQGNHVILNVPMEKDTIWLECTSQKTAFNHLGKFTHDRYALSVNSEGGTIVKTQQYKTTENLENLIGNGVINSDGKLDIQFETTASGLTYDGKLKLEYLTQPEIKNLLENRLDRLRNLKVNSFDFKNDKDAAKFVEKVNAKSDGFAQINGDNMIFPVIPAGEFEFGLKKDSYRKLPVEITNGFVDKIKFNLEIPENFGLNYEPEKIEIDSKYGQYQLAYTLENNLLVVSREFTLNANTYPKEEYMKFLDFIRSVEKADATKILLEKTNL